LSNRHLRMTKGIDFYRQQSIEWLKEHKDLYESNPPQGAVNVEFTIMKIKMVLKQKENELNKADSDSDDDSEGRKHKFDEVDRDCEKEAEEKGEDYCSDNINVVEVNESVKITATLLEEKNILPQNFTFKNQPKSESEDEIAFLAFFEADEMDPVQKYKYEKGMRAEEGPQEGAGLEIKIATLYHGFELVRQKEQYQRWLKFFLSLARHIILMTPSSEIKSVDVIKLTLDILYFFVQDANVANLYGFNYQLGEFLNVALEDQHACSAEQWHRFFKQLVNQLRRLEVSLRALLLDRMFLLLPRRLRCDQLRFFCYYHVVCDYLSSNVATYENDVAEFLEKRVERNKFSTSIELLDAYVDEFEVAPGHQVDMSVVRQFSAVYNENMVALGKIFLQQIESERRPQLTQRILVAFNFLCYQDRMIQKALLHDIPKNISKSQGNINLDMHKCERLIDHMDDAWKKYGSVTFAKYIPDKSIGCSWTCRLFLDEIKRESSKKGKKHDMKHEPKVEKNPITNYFKSSKLSA